MLKCYTITWIWGLRCLGTYANRNQVTTSGRQKILFKSFFILLIGEKKGDQILHVETIHGTFEYHEWLDTAVGEG